MLFYFALGMLILAGLLLAFNFFAKTDQKYLLKLFKWLLFIILGIAAIYYVISGRGGWALAMLPVALPYLIRLKNLFRVAKAFSYMKDAAHKGYPLSQHAYGFMFFEGECTEKDIHKSIEWFNSEYSVESIENSYKNSVKLRIFNQIF